MLEISGSRFAAVCVMVFLVIGLLAVFPAQAVNAPRVSVEKLNAMLDDPDLVVIDVRRAKDLKADSAMIKGAVLGDPTEFSKWKDLYPKDKTLVLYCA